MAEHLLVAAGPALGVDDAGVPAAVAALRGADGRPLRAYGVGYVELPGEVKVEARLTETDPEALRSAWRWSSWWCRSAPTTTATRS